MTNRYFTNMSEKNLGNGPDGLPLPDAITGVDENDNGDGQIDGHEDPDYGQTTCKNNGMLVQKKQWTT